MNLLNRLVGYFGYVPKVKSRRSYDAAINNRLTSDWVMSPLSADAEIQAGLRTIRARARDLAIKNDYAKKYLNMCIVNVLGPSGIILQNKARNTDGSFDTPANIRIEKAWAVWGKKESPTMDGRLSWVGVQKVVLKSTVRDGECLVRKIYGKPVQNKFQFALQILEADHLDENYNRDLPNGNSIRMGIEFDQWKRPVNYHLLNKHPGDYYNGSISLRYEIIPADQIIHLFDVERITQSRGVPFYHTAMTRLRMLGGYEEAELVAARVSAAKMGFFKSPTGEEYIGDDKDNKGNIINEAEPGSIEQLPAGVDFTAFDPQHPTNQFPFFMKTMLRGIASGLNVSYNSLASDLESVNYSSIRAGSIEERDSWKIMQTWFIDDFCQLVFEAWLDMALLTQAIKLPYEKFDKFNAPKWLVRGWQWVDPLKDSTANIDAINAGLKTRSMIVAEQGYDLEEIFEQLAEEKKLASQYGLSFENPDKPDKLKIINEEEKDEDKVFV